MGKYRKKQAFGLMKKGSQHMAVLYYSVVRELVHDTRAGF